MDCGMKSRFHFPRRTLPSATTPVNLDPYVHSIPIDLVRFDRKVTIVNCPTCNRLLYSRRFAKCGFCGAAIPENLRFTDAEIAALDKQIAESAKQRELAREKAEKEARDAANSGDSGIGFDSIFMDFS